MKPSELYQKLLKAKYDEVKIKRETLSVSCDGYILKETISFKGGDKYIVEYPVFKGQGEWEALRTNHESVKIEKYEAI